MGSGRGLGRHRPPDHIARKYEKARQNILAQLEDMGLVFPCYCDHCAESLDY